MDLSRRTFLRQAACAAVGTTGLLSAVWDLRKINAAAALSAPADYKCLVCLFLQGGNDSNNTVVPYGGGAYQDYAASRGQLALPASLLVPITPATGYAGPPLGLHANLSGLQGLFNQGRLAVVTNVGTLVEPLTQRQYLQGGVPKPNYLFSHDDQQRQWQSGISDRQSETGWGGRAADLVNALNGGDTTVSMSVSLGGTNLFETGSLISQFQLLPGSNGLHLTGYTADPNPDARSQAFRALLQQGNHNLFKSAYDQTTRRALDASQVLNQALSTSVVKTPFPNTPLGQQLQTVAQLIAQRTLPGMAPARNIFFCQVGGFDTHSDELLHHPLLLQEINDGLTAFYQATVELGVADQVTTFTASDFNRTLAINNSGSDHAWGGHHFVVGGAVRGNMIYGQFPTLRLGGPDDVDTRGEGRFIPTTSVDEYGATLARWFGVGAADLATVFPNLNRFPTGNDPQGLGFLNVG